jgi:hypothetical protein
LQPTTLFLLELFNKKLGLFLQPNHIPNCKRASTKEENAEQTHEAHMPSGKPIHRQYRPANDQQQ